MGLAAAWRAVVSQWMDIVLLLRCLLVSDVAYLVFEGQPVELFHRQRQHQLDAPRDFNEDLLKDLAPRLVAALGSGRGLKTPARRHGLTRPDRADLAGGLVAAGDHQIPRRRFPDGG